MNNEERMQTLNLININHERMKKEMSKMDSNEVQQRFTQNFQQLQELQNIANIESQNAAIAEEQYKRNQMFIDQLHEQIQYFRNLQFQYMMQCYQQTNPFANNPEVWNSTQGMQFPNLQQHQCVDVINNNNDNQLNHNKNVEMKNAQPNVDIDNSLSLSNHMSMKWKITFRCENLPNRRKMSIAGHGHESTPYLVFSALVSPTYSKKTRQISGKNSIWSICCATNAQHTLSPTYPPIEIHDTLFKHSSTKFLVEARDLSSKSKLMAYTVLTFDQLMDKSKCSFPMKTFGIRAQTSKRFRRHSRDEDHSNEKAKLIIVNIDEINTI